MAISRPLLDRLLKYARSGESRPPPSARSPSPRHSDVRPRGFRGIRRARHAGAAGADSGPRCVAPSHAGRRQSVRCRTVWRVAGGADAVWRHGCREKLTGLEIWNSSSRGSRATRRCSESRGVVIVHDPGRRPRAGSCIERRADRGDWRVSNQEPDACRRGTRSSTSSRFCMPSTPSILQRLMRRCVRVSNGPREADGFHALLEDPEQDLFDLACDREARRERQGLRPSGAGTGVHAGVTPSSARPRSTPTPSARARLFPQSRTGTRGAGRSSRNSAGLLPGSSADAITPDIEPAAMAEVVEILRDAGVLTEEPRALFRRPRTNSPASR